MKKSYATKKDGWLVALLWAAVLVMLGAAWNLWNAPLPFAFRLFMSVLLALSAAFVLWVLYGTRYTLTDSALVIRSGPFGWLLPLDSITEVFPTRNPVSSPACSLDRLHIRYGTGRSDLMISPEDKASFLQDLAARSSGLKVDRDRVLRRPE